MLTKFCLDQSDMPENPDDQPKLANYQNDLICSEQMTLKFISKFGVFPFVMPTMGRNNQDCSSCWKKTKVI